MHDVSDCKVHWTYEYTVNVTAQPSGFGRYAVSSGVGQSSVTHMNWGTYAGFDYKVTLECPLMGLSALSCNGTLEVGDPSVTCTLTTVPNQWMCLWDYTAVIQIRNRGWVYSVEGGIAVTQMCANGTPAGADLCSNGAFYGFIASASPTRGCCSAM